MGTAKETIWNSKKSIKKKNQTWGLLLRGGWYWTLIVIDMNTCYTVVMFNELNVKRNRPQISNSSRSLLRYNHFKKHGMNFSIITPSVTSILLQKSFYLHEVCHLKLRTFTTHFLQSLNTLKNRWVWGEVVQRTPSKKMFRARFFIYFLFCIN